MWEIHRGAMLMTARLLAQSEVTPEQREAQHRWEERGRFLQPTAAETARTIQRYGAGYLEIFELRRSMVVRFQSLFFYTFEFFDAAGMMLIGMALIEAWRLFRLPGQSFLCVARYIRYAIGLPL